MAVSRDYSIIDIAVKDNFVPAPTTETTSEVTGGNALLGGSISRTSTGFGRTATVKAGEDIRPALESLRSAGGGTLILLAGVHKPTYDIVGGSKINIVGEGIDQTVIDFGGGAYAIQFIGAEGSEFSNFSLRSFSVTNSIDTHAINIQWSEYFSIEEISSSSNDTGCNGIYISNSTDWRMDNCVFNSNAGHGISLYGSGEFTGTFRFQIFNTVTNLNAGSGIVTSHQYDPGGNGYGTFFNCYSDNNGDSAFDLGLSNSSFVACEGIRSGYAAFEVKGNKNVFTGCRGQLGGGNIFIVSGAQNTFLGCSINSTYTGFEVTGAGNVFLGSTGGETNSGTADKLFSFTNNLNYVDNSENLFPTSRKKILRMRNGSGGSLAVGDVVVFKVNVATGRDVTTTTTVGDDYVFGVALEASASNEYSEYLTEGFTDTLKVNGTTDIAVGDFLCTYSTAGIAQKAAAGDMAFAIALEAYTTNDSNGVIDALLITPRKL